MEAQVKNLILQDDSLFEQDPNFAFICWNMIQKHQASINSTFGVKASFQCMLACELEEVLPFLTSLAVKWESDPWAKLSTRKGKKTVRLLQKLSVVAENTGVLGPNSHVVIKYVH